VGGLAHRVDHVFAFNLLGYMGFSHLTEPPHQSPGIHEIPPQNVENSIGAFLNAAVA
jgi:hypothetical protein